ncbi:20348_t:CDS:10 [Dentiscutata erythropus]|uniref:20348_t:CDS:1 n=1 Tax=Dentiscutata erythropus TaxID=1348616 RepID=A0A9N9DLM6_9GLOM|nr:20348_t:CDS:10 [Dentiscutata erythropus]
MENSQPASNATDTPNQQSQPQASSYSQLQAQKPSHQFTSPPHNPKPKQHDNIDRLYTPQLKFTNFAAQTPIVTKYVTSKFLRHDVSYFRREETKKEATTEEEEPEQEGSKVLVIHPGSKYLRIGRASEAFPYVVPHDKQEEINTNFEDARMSIEKNTDITMENDDTKSDSGENWSGSMGSPAVMEEVEEDEAIIECTLYNSFIEYVCAMESKFPYAEMDLNRMYDWMLAEEMKEKFCTLDEANLVIQLNEFYVRAPNQPTLKYQIKTYDDAIISPMCLFYPHIINFHKKSAEFPPKFTSFVIDDMTEGVNTSTGLSPSLVMQKPKLSVATQATQVKTSFPSPSPQQRDSPGPMTPLRLENSAAPTNGPSPTSNTTPSQPRVQNASSIDPLSTLPLDEAIMQSINAAATEERAKKFYGSILLVGGGALISGIHKMLENRIFSRTLPFTDKFEILGSPRDLDPRLLAWKGGSVMSKLEIVNELWINSNEWEELGVRCLREKALFVW